MTQAVLTQYQSMIEKKEQDAVTVSNVAEMIKKEYQNFNVVSGATENKEDYGKIVRHTTLAMQKFANSHFKSIVGLEARDVEQIKDALKNFACSDERAKQIKNEIIEDLTVFQKNINTNHVQAIAEYAKQKQMCEKQVKVLEFEKHKLIADRLSKILWPYDAKTKEYDAKIADYQMKAKQLEQKMITAKQMRPIASAKDILLYEMKLKDKYLK